MYYSHIKFSDRSTPLQLRNLFLAHKHMPCAKNTVPTLAQWLYGPCQTSSYLSFLPEGTSISEKYLHQPFKECRLKSQR